MSRTYRKLRIRNYGGMDSWGGNRFYGNRYYTQVQQNALRAGPPPLPAFCPRYIWRKKWHDSVEVVASMPIPRTTSIEINGRLFPAQDWQLVSRLHTQRCYAGFRYDRIQTHYTWEFDPEVDDYTHHNDAVLERTRVVRKKRWVREYNPKQRVMWKLRDREWDEAYWDWINIHEHVYRNRSVHRQRINGIRITKRNNSHVRRRQEQRDLDRRVREYWLDEDWFEY